MCGASHNEPILAIPLGYSVFPASYFSISYGLKMLSHLGILATLGWYEATFCLLVTVILIFEAVRVWTTRGKTRVPLILASLALFTVAGAVQGVPIAPINAGLTESVATTWGFYGIPTMRLGVNAPGDAPISWWYGQSGTCSANGMVNDVGHCNNDAGSNSFVAYISPVGVDVREFGVKADVVYTTECAATVTGSPSLCASRGFTPADVGKPVLVIGGGSGGNPYVGSILSVAGVVATLNSNILNGGSSQFIVGVIPLTNGGGYAPGDTIVAAGGTASTPATLTVQTTGVFDAPPSTIPFSGGSGGNSGTYDVYGTTGNGNRVVFNVTVSGGSIFAINSIIDSGNYTTNPTTISAEPVSCDGCGLTGATVNLTGLMGVRQALPTTPGVYSSFPSTVTQASTSGSGSGATFSTLYEWANSAIVYGTDNRATLQNALNFGSATGIPLLLPPNGTIGVASAVQVIGSQVRLLGASGRLNITYDIQPVGGVTLQWLGSVGGGPVLEFAPVASSTAKYATHNTLDGLNIECGIPTSASQGGQPQPLGAYGLELLSQGDFTFQNFVGHGCSVADVYIGSISNGTSGSLDTIHLKATHIATINSLPWDGVGLWTGGNGLGDTDLFDLDQITAVYSGSPGLLLQSIDDSTIGTVHASPVAAPAGTYGMDIQGDKYGCSGSCPNQPSGLVLTGLIATTSITRGKETSANPPTMIRFTGEFDYGNSIPPVVCRALGEDCSFDLRVPQSYAPTWSSTGGSGVSISTGSAVYWRHQKNICVAVSGHLTASNTPTAVSFTLPPPYTPYTGWGQIWEETASGHLMLAAVTAGPGGVVTTTGNISGQISTNDFLDFWMCFNSQ